MMSTNSISVTKISMKRKKLIGKIIQNLVRIILVVITLIPFYVSVIYSFKYKNEITINHLA